MRIHVRVCLAGNSHVCDIWIANDMTDSNTCFFFVSGLSL